MSFEKNIRNLNIWKNEITFEKIKGGITNQNFLVNDGSKRYFVRIGKDIPEHLIFRENEINASKAASFTGVAPKFIYSAEGIIIFEYIQSTTYDSESIINNLDKIIEIIKIIHKQIPSFLSGSPPLFWVFYVINHYANFLKNNNSEYIKLLNEFLNKSSQLNKIASPYDIVFCHNDFLSANFIENESKIWVVDWEYAGFNTPLFDLGGLASNNNLNSKHENYLLENYFETKITDKELSKYFAIKCASLLRETMWSMVSEITSKIDFDYKQYTNENLKKFNDEFNNLNS